MLTQPSTNTIVWRWDRDPFGTTPPNTDPDANGLQLPFSQRLPGQTAFDESGLNYNYFRDYDPQTGRYVESDPIGLQGGLNTYAYTASNPVSHTDSMGLAVWVCKRDVDISWIPDVIAQGLPAHMWIKTDTREACMGGRCPVPGQQCSDRPYSNAEVNDHTGQSKQPGVTCTLQFNVDEGCVNRYLSPGTSTGSWNMMNQCNSWANSVIGSCRYRPQMGPRLPPGLPRSRGPLGATYGP